jgi:hypothetical protein
MYEHLLNLDKWWKESLKSNGQQFYQYQQKEHKKTTTYGVRNAGSSWEQAHKCGGVKQAISITTLSTWTTTKI